IGTGSNSWCQADIAGQMFRTGKSRDVSNLQQQHCGDEDADTGNGDESLDNWIAGPLPGQFLVDIPYALIDLMHELQTVIPNNAGIWSQLECLNFTSTTDSGPSAVVLRTHVSSCQQ